MHSCKHQQGVLLQDHCSACYSSSHLPLLVRWISTEIGEGLGVLLPQALPSVASWQRNQAAQAVWIVPLAFAGPVIKIAGILVSL